MLPRLFSRYRKSQTKALKVWDFPVTTKIEKDEVNKLFYCLWAIKTDQWITSHITSMSCTLEPVKQSGDTGQRVPFLKATNKNTDQNMNVYKDVHYQVKHRLYNALDTYCS